MELSSKQWQLCVMNSVLAQGFIHNVTDKKHPTISYRNIKYGAKIIKQRDAVILMVNVCIGKAFNYRTRMVAIF